MVVVVVVVSRQCETLKGLIVIVIVIVVAVVRRITGMEDDPRGVGFSVLDTGLSENWEPTRHLCNQSNQPIA